MEILYPAEHLNCYMYNNKGGLPVVDYVKKAKGEIFELNEPNTEIVFLLEGRLVFSYGRYLNHLFKKGEILLLPPKTRCVVKVEDDVSAIIFRVHSKINFCDHFPLEMLYENKKKYLLPTLPHLLKINSRVSAFLKLLTASLNDGLKCLYFQELKQREFLFYLRAYYPKEELLAFFYPILNSDIRFSELVYKHIDKVKKLDDLASITNYSLSGFKKRFMKVFGMPAYQWMSQEKAKRIYHDINCTKKTFKELSVAYEFSSSAHFNSFCKKAFGVSPSKIRHQNQASIIGIQMEEAQAKNGRHVQLVRVRHGK
ncbi:MAG: AraC family transcriptional regulator [Prevotellaceae bacterium]|jgi:AraC-like DNA-binding protein|nr:AraC family transcriptional regulator [Prevotellaceae bacterium]